MDTVKALGKKYLAGTRKDSIFWVDLPLWYHSNRKLPQFYQQWANVTSLPILLYNHPHLIKRLNRSLKRKNLRTAVLKRLSENDQIMGLIQSGDLQRTIYYQRAVRARRDFRFYDGDENSFLNGPSSSGVVSWGANLLPAEWQEIVHASLGLLEDPVRNILVLKQSEKLRDLHQALRSNPVQGIKMALHHLGFFTRDKVLDETKLGFAGDEAKIENFLRKNFSLQLPP